MDWGSTYGSTHSPCILERLDYKERLSMRCSRSDLLCQCYGH